MVDSEIVDLIMQYEGGELTEDETVEFFQRLVTTGLAWKLQGAYGRQAKALLEAGLVHEPRAGTYTP